MEIANRNSYYNAINEAIVVNNNTDTDPEHKGRVQVYIPSIHIEYVDIYQNYMNSQNKQDTKGWDLFPWAVTLVPNLKNGNIVYMSTINNENDNYIILGLDVNNEKNINTTNSSISGSVSGVLDLAMPIILRNEVGINTMDWPNNIPNHKYNKITPFDNGGWSIGLIQWHHCRAFDCLFEIAKADSNWIKNWPNTNLSIVQDLKNSVNAGTDRYVRTKYQGSFHPTIGTAQYIGIKNMLSSSIGKDVQRKYAMGDTEQSLKIISNEPYNISNPAILIFLLDIMNQYGQGLPNTIKKASSINSTGGNIMDQLNSFRNWCKYNLGSYNKYINRRNTTYTYIEQLYNTGKLNINTVMPDMAALNMGGQLLWPTPGCKIITSKYGMRVLNGRQNMHTGVDLARNGGAAGQEIYAAHSGTIKTRTTKGGYGILTIIENGNLSTYYAHQCKRANGITDGVKVNAGQLIGFVGNTGNSFGAHLHFEVRFNGKHTNPLPYIKKG